jgi:hypothetical protein
VSILSVDASVPEGSTQLAPPAPDWPKKLAPPPPP